MTHHCKTRGNGKHVSWELINIQKVKIQRSNLPRINFTCSWYAKQCKGLLIWRIVCLLCASICVWQKITTWHIMHRLIDIFGTPGHSVQVLVDKLMLTKIIWFWYPKYYNFQDSQLKFPCNNIPIKLVLLLRQGGYLIVRTPSSPSLSVGKVLEKALDGVHREDSSTKMSFISFLDRRERSLG
jgi:hypothetical protein